MTRKLVVDSREKSATLKAAADEVRLLAYENPTDPAHPWSYDIEVTTEAGQVLCFERKMGGDLLGSFDKLERQLAPCDGLIVEGFNERAWLLSDRADDPKFVQLVHSTRKRLWRLALKRAVLFTANEGETLELLRYLQAKSEPLETRE